MQRWLVNRRETQRLSRVAEPRVTRKTAGLTRLRNALASSALTLVAMLTPQVALAEAPAPWLVVGDSLSA
ncbi:hypothetical protein ACYTTR_19750, partial [Cobetia marina]